MPASSTETDAPDEDEETQDWEDDAHISDHLEACYRAIFGHAHVWYHHNLPQKHVFVDAHVSRRILSLWDFYTRFEEVKQLFRQHNFIAEYAALRTATGGVEVTADEAVVRLTSLHAAIQEKGVQWVQDFVADFIRAHDPPGVEDVDHADEAVDEEILALLQDYRPPQPFDDLGGFLNSPRPYRRDARAHEARDSVTDKENIAPDSRAAHLSVLLERLRALRV
jgi:hypothetical protein